MATFPSKVNYATGDILTATNMNDVGGAINLLQSSQFSAGKNAIINGDFGIWQRGTSFASPASGTYCADRYKTINDGTGATRTISQQAFTAGTAPVAGYEGTYFMRYAVSVVGTGNTYQGMQQYIEDVRTFAGQTVTFSFWAKAEASKLITVDVTQYFGSGGSANVQTQFTAQTVTTSWARYSATVAVPSISGKTIGAGNALQFGFYVPAAATCTFDIWGIQLEAASTASNFQTATGTKQGELAACQRYLPAFNFASQINVLGYAYSTTASQYNIPLPVTPRVRPTGLTISALSDFTVYNQGFGSGTPTAISFNAGGQICQVNVTTTAGSPVLVTGQIADIQLTGANGILLFTGCEL
jgi:hypothetical protein